MRLAGKCETCEALCEHSLETGDVRLIDGYGLRVVMAQQVVGPGQGVEVGPWLDLEWVL